MAQQEKPPVDRLTRKLDPSPCALALTQHAVCEKANAQALAIMRAGNLTVVTVMQDVQTGALVSFAASDPSMLNVTTLVLPLSTVKLMLAASWWDHGLPETPQLSTDTPVSVTDMVVNGSDNVGRQMATTLRNSIGGNAVLDDLKRYGFPSTNSPGKSDQMFWSRIDPQLEAILLPASPSNSLTANTSTQEWEDTLSIGEAKFTVTGLHLSRFLQAIGNGGVMFPPSASKEKATKTQTALPANPTRVMKEGTALKLQAAMLGVVKRGTASSIADILSDTGWHIGGKTGTGQAQLDHNRMVGLQD